MSQCEQDVLLT